MAVDYLNNDVVIIGSGVVAFNAIKAIRETDKSIDIHLIARPINPYYRTRLTKAYLMNLILIRYAFKGRMVPAKQH